MLLVSVSARNSLTGHHLTVISEGVTFLPLLKGLSG